VRCDCAVTSAEMADLKATSSAEMADLKATFLKATATIAELVERNLTPEEDKKKSNS